MNIEKVYKENEGNDPNQLVEYFNIENIFYFMWLYIWENEYRLGISEYEYRNLTRMKKENVHLRKIQDS